MAHGARDEGARSKAQWLKRKGCPALKCGVFHAREAGSPAIHGGEGECEEGAGRTNNALYRLRNSSCKLRHTSCAFRPAHCPLCLVPCVLVPCPLCLAPCPLRPCSLRLAPCASAGGPLAAKARRTAKERAERALLGKEDRRSSGPAGPPFAPCAFFFS